MVTCLILKNGKNNKLLRELSINMLLRNKDYETITHDDEQSIVFVWNVTKEYIWQCVLELECSNFVVGYGFGEFKRDARYEALDILKRRESIVVL